MGDEQNIVLRILAVDDEEAILRLYQDVLSLKYVRVAPQLEPETEAQSPPEKQDLSFEVILARQADEAIKEVRRAIRDKRPFSAIFLDVCMPPGPDGIVAAEQIRALDPNVTIVMVTGYLDSDPAAITRRVPPADKLLFVQKPLAIREIRQFAQALGAKWLAERRQSAEHAELEAQVTERTGELDGANKQLQLEAEMRRETVEALRKSEEKYRLLAENATDVIWTSDMNLKFSYVSPSVKRVLGYEVNEMLSRAWKDILTPDSLKLVSRTLDEELNVDELSRQDRFRKRTLELEHIRKDGSTIWCEVALSLRWKEENQPVGFQGVTRDLTEYRQACEGLLLATERWQKTFDAMDSLVAVLDREHRIVQANRAMREVFADRQVIGAPCYELFHGTDAPLANCVSCSLFNSGKAAHIELQESHLGNRWFSVYAYPITDHNGSITQVVHVMRDITERKTANALLRESEAKFRSMFEGAVTGIAFSDMSGKLAESNSALQEMLGYTGEELRGMCFSDFTHPDDLASDIKYFEEMVAGKRDSYRIEKRYVRKDEQVVWGLLGVSVVREFSGEPRFCIAMVEDITERKRAQMELQQRARDLAELNARLERSNRDLEDFTYSVSHDLQEPLRKVSAFGQFLLEDCADELSDTGKDHLRRMQDAVERMNGLIRHLLNLSRIGTCGGEFVAVDAHVLVQEVLDTLSPLVQECGAEIIVADELPWVKADPVQMGRVLQNLIGNALKFHSPERAPRVVIDGRVTEGEVLVSIADNGIGIGERYRERIFGVFKRLHGRDQYEGDGVGLALCAKIIGRHGGRIWVESEVGKGSTFYFTLPQAEAAAAAPRAFETAGVS